MSNKSTGDSVNPSNAQIDRLFDLYCLSKIWCNASYSGAFKSPERIIDAIKWTETGKATFELLAKHGALEDIEGDPHTTFTPADAALAMFGHSDLIEQLVLPT